MKILVALAVVFTILCPLIEAGDRTRCPSNEVFGCGCFDKICNQPVRNCIRCAAGCFCANNLVREREGGKCIQPSNCLKPVPRCANPNEEFACKCRHEVCGYFYPQVVCDKCSFGCYCKKGFLREDLGGGRGGKCVAVKDCKKKNQ